FDGVFDGAGVAVVEDSEYDMVGACGKVFADPGNDCVLVSPGHQFVYYVVIEVDGIVVGEAHLAHGVRVPASTQQSSQCWFARSLPGTVGIGVTDDQLINDQRGVVSQDFSCPGGVSGSDQ